MADDPSGNVQLPETNASLKDINSWGLANVFAQKFALENAMIGKVGQVEAPPVIPFGSTYNVTTNTTSSGLGKLASAALLTAALAGGGVGAAALLKGGAAAPEAPAVADAAKPALGPRIVEGLIDWEFDPNGGFSIRPDGSGDGTANGSDAGAGG